MLEAQVRACSARGSRHSIILALARAGAGVGAHAVFIQAAFALAHGVAALGGFMLSLAAEGQNQAIAAGLMGGVCGLFGLIPMTILIVPLCGFGVIVHGALGMVAGAVCGTSLVWGSNSAGSNRLDLVLAGLRGQTRLDTVMRLARGPLRLTLRCTPLITLMAAFDWKCWGDVGVWQSPSTPAPDFESRRSKFTVVDREGPRQREADE